MELRRDITLPVIVLMALQVVTALAAIGLLARMAPAIERILAENVYSLEATEEMLAVLASDARAPDAAERFHVALARADQNVTEDEERVPLRQIHVEAPAALAGEGDARAQVAAALLELGRINRAAMVAADRRAKRLGMAGAWAAFGLGVIAFGFGLLAIGRLRRRVLTPLEELIEVIAEHGAGEERRRCRRMPAPVEVNRAMTIVDELLDRVAARNRRPERDRHAADRRALLHFLDQLDAPAFLLRDDGEITAASASGREALGADDDLAARLRTAVAARSRTPGDEDSPAAPDDHSEIDVTELAESTLLLCQLRAR